MDDPEAPVPPLPAADPGTRAPSTEALDRIEAELGAVEADLAALEADDGSAG